MNQLLASDADHLYGMWSSPDSVGKVDYRAMPAYIDALHITDEFLSELEITLRLVSHSKVKVFKEEFSGKVEYRIEVGALPQAVKCFRTPFRC